MSAAERFRRVDALFDAALDLAPADRAAFLDGVTPDDADLRADVERLLRAHDRSDGFLATPAAALGASLLFGTAERDAEAVAHLQRVVGDAYVVERPIGRGGMAVVYLAQDLRHGRRVAIKRLSPALGAMLGAERFLAEIRVMAGLQHPNLLPLFDSGGEDDVLYYVMPYVDGETLRGRMTREGRLPEGEAVRLAVAIAGALDYAHRRGVIHRDLKPENVLLQDGEPLVADFGIALSATGAGGERLTQAGALLGTARYMSPEQAAGAATVDARSDVYSLGMVLHEMLAGRTPEIGDGTPTAIARATGASRSVTRAIARALSLRPADRFASAPEFAIALGDESGLSARLSRTGRGLLWTAAGAVVVIGAAAAAWRLGHEPATAAHTARFVVSTDADPALGSLVGGLTITPDGRSLVYTGAPTAGHPVVVRPIDALRPRALPGTEGAFSPFVSPDGKWVGYFSSDDKLEKVPIDGGAPTVLAGLFRFSGARWSSGGVIVIAAYGRSGLAWVRDTGGPLHALTQFDSTAGDVRHGSPLILPDGRTVVFTVSQRFGPGPEDGVLATATIDTAAAGPARHRSLGVAARYAVAWIDGWLLYVTRDGHTLAAVRFDPAAARTSGAPVTVLEEPDGDIGDAQLSTDGTLVYTRHMTRMAPVLVSETGERRPLLGDAATDAGVMNPRLSPDGRQLALLRTSPQGSDIWVYELASRTATRLTSTGNAVGPAWTPDGRRIVFVSNASGGEALWWQPADGSAPAERLLTVPGVFGVSVTPDGRTLLFQRQLDDVWGIWSSSLGSDRVARPVLRERFDDYMPTVSPDGRWMAYASNATGRYEIYVRPFSRPGAAVQVSVGGGTEPAWAPDGHRLFYRDDRHLQAATVATAPSFAITGRATLFADDFGGEMPHLNYAVTADAKHFVMIGGPATAGPETVVVLDWVSELRARLAAGR